jgi:hypothetical protein
MKTKHLTLLFLCATLAALADPATNGHSPSPEFENFPVVHEQPLFEKLAVDGPRVSMWNRAYTLKPDGLLAGIDNAGTAFLSAPMQLTGRVNGTDLTTVNATSEVVESGAFAHVIRSRATIGAVALTTLTRIENDGMIRFTIELASEEEVTFEDIAIRLPLNNALFDYLHYIAETRAKSASLDLPTGTGFIWGSRDAQILYEKEVREHRSDVGGALKNANVKNSFLPFVWVGSGSAGVAWFAESDAGWQDLEGRSIIELSREGDVLEMSVHAVMGQLSRKVLTLDFGLQATPVKPLPDRWRTWQHYNARGLRAGRMAERNQRTYDENIIADFGDILMFDLDCIGLETPHRFSRKITNPEATRDFIQRYRDKNYKVFSYVTPFLIDQDEAAADGRKDWLRVPYLSRPWSHDGIEKRQDYLCHNAPGNLLHILQSVEDLVVNYGLDGVYIDVPFFNGGCMAPGCTHTRTDGSPQPIFRIFQMREFYKKLASIFIRHGKYPYLLIHNSTGTLIPAYSWCWAGKPGEFMADIGYSMNHNEYFRDHRAKAIIELNPHPWGLVTFCMDDLKFTRYEIIRSKEDRPFKSKEAFEDHLKSRYIGIPLLHDGLLMNWCSTPKFSYSIHQARKAFGIGEDDVSFHPYWDKSTLQSGHPSVALSYYLRPQGVMLSLVNFSDADVTFDLTLSPDILQRLKGSPLTDPLSGETLEVKDGKAKITIPAQLYRLLTQHP